MYQVARITVSVAALILVLALASACVPVAREPAVAAVATESPATESSSTADLRTIPVENVTLEVGVGSPIPVDIFVSGSWPDLCAQLAEMEQHSQDFQIDITLLATPAEPNCPPDLVGMPFRIAVPLNTVELPDGTYTVTANGVTTTFELPVQPPAVSDPTTDEHAAFAAEVERIIQERNYEQMPAMMGDRFMLAGWRSEGSAYRPEAAIEQLQTNYLGQDTAIAFRPVPDSLAAELQGVFGPDVDVANQIYVTGWGLEGEDEAILYVARRPDGGLYWHGVLFAPVGFAAGN